jgi:NADH:ubiquinone oxidoreductase subunit 5 (subunit L)/multisubunit Na+/H+ antiporter MnhA subunit
MMNNSCEIKLHDVTAFSVPGIATPMQSMYHYFGPVHIVNVDCDILPSGLYFCTTPDKKFKIEYYLSVYILIFLPLFVIFVGFYVVVAMYVWKQRIPISKRAPAQTSSNETATTSTNKNDTKIYNKANTKTTPRYLMNTTSNTGTRSTLLTDSSSGTPLNRRRQNDNKAETPLAEPLKCTTQTKRKVRTFKVIMVLIASCFIGRVPSWTYTVVQSNPNIRLREMKWWLLQDWFTILSLLSTALNPFLYCFLNETLDFIQGVFRFIRNIFEYCCYNRQIGNKMNVKTNKQQVAVEEEQIRSVSIVPRGPYLNNEENRPRALTASVKVNHI